MALVFQAGMDSPYTCHVQEMIVPGPSSGIHQVPGRAVQVAWDLPQASPRCPFWLRRASPRPVPAAGLSILGLPSGVARAASFVCRKRMPSKPDVVYRRRARLMALVPKAGMDSPLTCRVQEMTVFQVCLLASLSCQAGRSSVRRGPASGFTLLSQVCSFGIYLLPGWAV